MIFVPVGTDAPLYHLPITTVSLIVVNLVTFIGTLVALYHGDLSPEGFEGLMVDMSTVNPVQWFTALFMHAGPGHLLGNLAFLFVFGVVVEGKIGSLQTLGIYLSVGVLVNAIMQVVGFCVGSEAFLLGASAAISSLMIIAFFWAPENEVTFWYWIMWIIAGTFEARILTVAIIYNVLDIASVFLSGFGLSGSMGHLLGAALGAPVAVWYLRTARVDCEGWDLITKNPWLQQYPILYSERQRQANQANERQDANPVEEALRVTGGDVTLAGRIGMNSNHSKPSASQSHPVAGSGAAEARASAQSRKRGFGRGDKQRVQTDASIAKRIKQAQADPRLGELASVFSQNLAGAASLPSANEAFRQADALGLSIGLSEDLLMRYASALSDAQQYMDAIRPLAVILEQQQSLANRAGIMLTRIQLQVMKRPDLAAKTFRKINLEPSSELQPHYQQLKSQVQM